MRAPTAILFALLPLVLSACKEPTGSGRGSDQLLVGRFMDSSMSLDLFLVEVEGQGAVNLTGTPDANEFSPAWSPDGRRIAYVRTNARHTPAVPELWVIRADGTQPARIAQGGAGEPIGWPAWSPDGTRIAFPLGERLMVVPVAGGAATPIVTELRSLGWPSWSPDGSRIVFDAHGENSWNIYTVRPDGTALTRVTPTSVDDGHPAWSPDGTRLAVSRSGFTEGSWSVWTLDPDGGSPVRITSAAEHAHAFPTWSPDGRRIAYVVMGGETVEGMIVPVDDSAVARSLGRVVPGRLAWRP